MCTYMCKQYTHIHNTHVYTHSVCIQTHTYIHMYTHMPIHICVCIYTCIYMYIYYIQYPHTCTHVVCVYRQYNTHVRMCTYMYTQYPHTCMCRHTYTHM